MSWHDAHRYNHALRTAEADLNCLPDVELIWRPEYRPLFGSPERLVLALRSRWHTMLQAQVDDVVTEEGEPSGAVRELAGAHPGLVRALVRAGAIAEIDIAEIDIAEIDPAPALVGVA